MGLNKQPDETSDFSLQLLRENFPDGILDALMPQGDATAVIRPEFLPKIVDFLKSDPRLLFDILIDITAVDYAAMKPAAMKPVAKGPRFCVVYHFLSLQFNRRLRLKVFVEEGEPVLSLTSFWGSANWLEREVWDMFGIRFTGHPDLKRILMYDEFEGHPLRKDYPIRKRQPRIGPKI
jgi:NADH-quinone oxidoreductase subunit C